VHFQLLWSFLQIMWWKSVIFLLLLVALSIEGQSVCPDNCSSHGKCVEKKCVCDKGFSGNDCSIALRLLPADGKAVSNVIAQWESNYFLTELDSPALIEWVLTQQAGSGDCDIFIKHGSVPTFFTPHDAKDVSDNALVRLRTPSARSGQWFVQVYAFMGECHYTLSARIIDDTPCMDLHECYGRGDCRNGRCECAQNYWDKDCSLESKKLNIGSTINGDIEQYGWLYFTVDRSQSNAPLIIRVKQVGEGDVDILLRKGEAPTILNYTASEMSPDDEFSIELPPNSEGRHGEWVIGLFAWEKTSFTLSVERREDGACTNECSHHGRCLVGQCECDDKTTGIVCERYKAPLRLNEAATGYVATGGWMYFEYTVETSENLLVHVRTDPPDVDLDLFVRRDGDPTWADNDFFDTSTDPNFSLLIEEATGNWHFGVYGWGAAEFTITISLSSDCPCNDASHGHCPANSVQCVCDAGWAGPFCNNTVHKLDSWETYGGASITREKTNYYSITCKSSFLYVVVAPQQYGDRESFPIHASVVQGPAFSTGTPMLQQLAPVESAHSNTKLAALVFSEPVATQTYFIVVRGMSTMNSDVAATFDIEATCSPA